MPIVAIARSPDDYGSGIDWSTVGHASDGRLLQIGWLVGMGGSLSITRELTYVTAEDLLLVNPVGEYASLRLAPPLCNVSGLALIGGQSHVLSSNASRNSDVAVSFMVPAAASVGRRRTHFGVELWGETAAVLTVNMSVAPTSLQGHLHGDGGGGGRLNVTVAITQQMKNPRDGNATTTLLSFLLAPDSSGDGGATVDFRSLTDDYIWEMYLGGGRLPYTAHKM